MKRKSTCRYLIRYLIKKKYFIQVRKKIIKKPFQLQLQKIEIKLFPLPTSINLDRECAWEHQRMSFQP